MQSTATKKKAPKVNPFAQKAAAAAAGKGDVGKHNNGKTTGFSAVKKSAKKEGYSAAVAQKIAGAEYQKMKKAGKV